MADIKLPDGEAGGSSATRWSRATRWAVGTGVALMVVVGFAAVPADPGHE
jgi:hypothetical protein